MRTRTPDIVWGSVCILCAALLIVGAVRVAAEFSGLALLSLTFPLFIAAGAWRRTKWGAPEGGLREYQEQRATARNGQP